jgi:uncharacterized protein YjiS (DUF1127 family)
MTIRVFAEKSCEPRAGLLVQSFAKLRCRREQARRRGLLHELDDRMLRDIGLSRGDVLSRTLLADAGAAERLGHRRAPASLTARPFMSRTALALMIITLTIAATVLAV